MANLVRAQLGKGGAALAKHTYPRGIDARLHRCPGADAIKPAAHVRVRGNIDPRPPVLHL